MIIPQALQKNCLPRWTANTRKAEWAIVILWTEKPHPYDYDNLSEFFNKGEKRLAPNVNGGFYVQEWDGNKFIPADNEYVNIKYSAKVENLMKN